MDPAKASTAAPPAGALPRSVKLAFGAPAFAGAAMAIPIGVLMPRFYSDVVLAPLGYIAISIALARAFDALTDPFMGWLSDRTRTRWGRRKPFIAVGAPMTALAFCALFAPPEFLTPGTASLWFAASFGLYFLFHTILDIPYAALGAELSPDYRERSNLFGYRTLFIAAGTVVASVFPTLLDRVLGLTDERAVYAAMAGVYAVLLVALNGRLLVRVPERPQLARVRPHALVPGVRRSLRNRPFRILLLAAVVGAIPAAIPALLMPYFVRYVLQPEDPNSWVGIYLLVYLGLGLLCVPFWMGVASRLGKLRTVIITSSIGITGSVFYFFAGPGEMLFAGCFFFMTGTVSMSGNFLFPAMAADVIDYDELRTGKRREAQYMAFWAMIPKFVAIPGSSVPLAVLAAVGYLPNQVQTEEVLFWIRFMYSMFPAVFYVTALMIVSRYPISERIHQEIRRGIAAHAEGATAVDPLTGGHLAPPGTRAVAEEDGWFLDYFTSRELRKTLERGPRRLVASVVVDMAISLPICLGAAALAIAGMQGAETRPGLTTVFAVVAAGLALTAFLFHALRLRPARRMLRDPLPDATLRAHLEEEVEGTRSDTSPRREPGGNAG
jgi:GPH family glycoside/pentoside/hexuronide:cation symporter